MDRMSGSSPPPLSSLLTSNKLEPPLAAEMWAFLKALATQLHINVELATSFSSSTATEPSPVQGSKHKDKAPTSPEDSNNDDEDIAKFVLGGKSSSLAQGSGALLYNSGLHDPRASCCPTCMRTFVPVTYPYDCPQQTRLYSVL